MVYSSNKWCFFLPDPAVVDNVLLIGDDVVAVVVVVIPGSRESCNAK
jgi:hypothetical protein